jgi:hypothetical protein
MATTTSTTTTTTAAMITATTTTVGTAAGAVAAGVAAAMTTNARVRRPAPGWVFGGALGTFFAALALLAVQVRAGEDPSLGQAKPVAAVREQPRKVIVKRKVIKRVVVHHPRPTAVPAAPSSGAASAPPTASAPSAPAPVAAPAPAPAPAPLTTQSS